MSDKIRIVHKFIHFQHLSRTVTNVEISIFTNWTGKRTGITHKHYTLPLSYNKLCINTLPCKCKFSDMDRKTYYFYFPKYRRHNRRLSNALTRRLSTCFNTTLTRKQVQANHQSKRVLFYFRQFALYFEAIYYWPKYIRRYNKTVLLLNSRFPLIIYGMGPFVSYFPKRINH